MYNIIKMMCMVIVTITFSSLDCADHHTTFGPSSGMPVLSCESDSSSDDEPGLQRKVGAWSLKHETELHPQVGDRSVLASVLDIDPFVIEEGLWKSALADDSDAIKSQFQGIILQSLADGIRSNVNDRQAQDVLRDQGTWGMLRMFRMRHNGRTLVLPPHSIHLLSSYIHSELRARRQAASSGTDIDVIDFWRTYADQVMIDRESVHRVVNTLQVAQTAQASTRIRKRILDARRDGESNDDDLAS